MSLLNVSCIFSILFQRFWIITLNSFSSRLPISSSFFGVVGFYSAPSSASYFSVFSFCLTYCVWGLFFSGCISHIGSVGSVRFLVEGTDACVLVDEAGSWLSGGQDCVRRFVLRCL